MQIYLVGFMGSGKSTVGRKLARILKSEFIDLDSFIEKESEMTISQWFEMKGEEAFREYESQVLRKLNPGVPVVIATGGGTPCYMANMDWMNEHGVTVYIRMDELSLFHRLKMAQKPRPLLENMEEDELMDFINSKLGERRPVYESAAIAIRGENADVKGLAGKLQQISEGLN